MPKFSSSTASRAADNIVNMLNQAEEAISSALIKGVAPTPEYPGATGEEIKQALGPLHDKITKAFKILNS